MGQKNKPFGDRWYIDLFVGFMGLVLLYSTYDHYNTLLFSPDLPSGKGGKFGILLLRLLDAYGGKPLVFGALLCFSLFCFISAYNKFKHRFD